MRSAEALSKLVSDLKENLILNDFSTINETTSRRIDELGTLQARQIQRMENMYKGTIPSMGVGGTADVTFEPRTT